MSKSFDEAVKEYEKEQKTKKWVKRKKQVKKTYSTINRALDLIEGKPLKTQKTKTINRIQQNQQYVIRNGVAYPVYRSHKKTHAAQTSAKPRRSYDVFGSPISKNKKKKKDPFDLRINW